MHLSTAVQWVAIISVLIVGAGVIGAAFRSAGNARALENYRSLAESYRMKNDEAVADADRLKAEMTGLHEEMADKDRQIADLRGKISTLTELIAGRAVFDQLATQLGEVKTVVAQIAVKVGA